MHLIYSNQNWIITAIFKTLLETFHFVFYCMKKNLSETNTDQMNLIISFGVMNLLLHFIYTILSYTIDKQQKTNFISQYVLKNVSSHILHNL